MNDAIPQSYALATPLGTSSRNAAPEPAKDTLTLTVGQQNLTGWQRVSVTRPLAAIPASFDVEVTERYPLVPDIDIEPGAPCTVQIGADLVITGYVDRYQASITPGSHSIRISGRSKSCDLVDCSALVSNTAIGSEIKEGLQVTAGNALGIITKLAAEYNVTVQSTAGDGVYIPQFNIMLGETVWEIIDRLSRTSELLVYDLPDGTLMLSTPGAGQMASGFAFGQNIESADVTLSMDGRYQEYEGHLLSNMAMGTDAGPDLPGVGEVIRDDGVPRFRKRYIISEQFWMGEPLAGKRAIWEKNRRWGQSYAINLICDSWRDSAGKLWEPNYLATVQAAPLKVPNANWCIASVNYTRDESGQHSNITLMPKEAFYVEPTVPDMLVTVGDVNAYNATKNNPPPAPEESHFKPVGVAATQTR